MACTQERGRRSRYDGVNDYASSVVDVVDLHRRLATVFSSYAINKLIVYGEGSTKMVPSFFNSEIIKVKTASQVIFLRCRCRNISSYIEWSEVK